MLAALEDRLRGLELGVGLDVQLDEACPRGQVFHLEPRVLVMHPLMWIEVTAESWDERLELTRRYFDRWLDRRVAAALARIDRQWPSLGEWVETSIEVTTFGGPARLETVRYWRQRS